MALSIFSDEPESGGALPRSCASEAAIGNTTQARPAPTIKGTNERSFIVSLLQGFAGGLGQSESPGGVGGVRSIAGSGLAAAEGPGRSGAPIAGRRRATAVRDSSTTHRRQ